MPTINRNRRPSRLQPATTPRAESSATADTGSGQPVAPTEADFRPEFRISSRVVPGAASQKAALKSDWFDAAVAAEAKFHASGEVDALVAAAAKTQMEALGRELTEPELGQLAHDIDKVEYRPRVAKHFAALNKDSTSRQAAVTAAMQREGNRLIQRGFDPFTPIIQNDPQALAREVILYQDANALVVVDQFCPSPKALVIPKKSAMFPSDLSDAEIDGLADIAQKVSAAFHKVAGGTPAEVWINPPQRLTVSQLHVHVRPHLRNWEEERRPRGEPPPPELVAEQQKFYAKLSAELNAPPATSTDRLGIRG